MNVRLLAFSVLFVVLSLIAASLSLLSEIRGTGTPLEAKSWRRLVLFLTIMSCILPMGLSPTYNGEEPEHRDQYERLADALISGSLELKYDLVDERIYAMENPYDAEERERLGIYYYWDHAYYDGHYYVYFGVVPALFLFVPYKLLTGTSLTTYHATEIFTALHLLGLYLLFRVLSRKFLKQMSTGLFSLLFMAFSYMSCWYAIACPALYATAITGALCFGSLSLWLFAHGALEMKTGGRQTACILLACLLGALEFGCRPPIGLSNLVALPLFFAYVGRGRGKVKRLLTAFPYLLVALCLMWYNYARFKNPFEFGQSYQLTITDQSSYGNMLSRVNLSRIAHGFYYFLFNLSTPAHIISIGQLIAYPILTVSYLFPLQKSVRTEIRKQGLIPLILFTALAICVIILFEVLWAPHPTPRYRMDMNWLMGILSFLLIGLFVNVRQDAAAARKALGILCMLAIGVSILFALYPDSGNFLDYYSGEIRTWLHV